MSFAGLLHGHGNLTEEISAVVSFLSGHIAVRLLHTYNSQPLPERPIEDGVWIFYPQCPPWT